MDVWEVVPLGPGPSILPEGHGRDMAPAREDYSELAFGYPAAAGCGQSERGRVTSQLGV